MKKNQKKKLLNNLYLLTISVIIYVFLALFIPMLKTLIIMITIISIIVSIYIYYKKKYTLCFAYMILSCILLLYACFYPNTQVQDFRGIDISKWNGDVELSNDEYDFVIIRVGYTSSTDGETHKLDDQFHANVQKCIDADLPYGFYYYSLATNTTQATKEANFVLEQINGYDPTVGVFIDMEDPTYQEALTKEELTDITLSFLNEVEEKYTNVGVYANHYWWQEKLDIEVLDKYLLWIAIYDSNYILEPPFDIYQYTNTGNVTGIDGDVDINVVNEKFW